MLVGRYPSAYALTSVVNREPDPYGEALYQRALSQRVFMSIIGSPVTSAGTGPFGVVLIG